MKKEELLALGLTEEQADKVITGFGNMIPKARFDEVNNAKNEYEKQVKEYMKKVEELTKSAKTTEELQAQLAELKANHDKEKAEYEKKLKETQLASALKLQLTGKVHDVDIVGNLLDKSKLELDENGNIKSGLEDQLKTLKESKSFLFVPENNPNPNPFIRKLGGDGNDKKPSEVKSLQDAVAAALYVQK